MKYADRYKLKYELLTSEYGHAVIKVTGESAWSRFRMESGKHVIQRVPRTERGGRRHTSLVSVAVLPLPQKPPTSIPTSDISIKTQRGHGKGGQNQNKVESAVRATHIPTGMSVFINGRDQLRNKQDAIQILTTKVLLSKEAEASEKYGIIRREQLGDGSRGSKVRTYNLIKGFVTDHRTGKTTKQPDRVMKGELDLVL